MNYGEGPDKDINIRPDRKREIIKDEMIDDTFKRARMAQINRSNRGKIKPKKPFLKAGILVIVISLLCLAIVNFVPWIYIEYEDSELGTIKETFTFGYETDFKNEKLESVSVSEVNITSIGKIYGLFETQCSTCSDNSNNFIGLSITDFSDTSKTATYAFFILILLSLFLLAFQIVDKIRDASRETTAIIHSIFAAGVMITSTYVILIIMKFFGAYILISSNSAFLSLKNPIIAFITPILLVVIVPLLIIGSNAILKMNFNELKNKFTSEIPENSFANYKFGGRSQ